MLESDQPADRVYWLEPYLLAGAAVPDEDAPALMLSVQAAPGLDTDRVLVLEPDRRLNHYEGARWADHVPDVVASLLERTLESTGRFSRVHARPGQRADWSLTFEVREFYVLDGAANVAAAGHLECGPRVVPVAAAARAGIGEVRLGRIVSAYQAALNELSAELAAQIDRAPCS